MQDITLKEILEMDVKSDEFFDVYKKVSTKYWTFEKPDDLQKAAAALVMFAERYDTDKVILSHTIIAEIINLEKDKGKSSKGHLAFKDCEYYFDIYQTEKDLDDMNDMLKKAGQKIKKGKFGKDYFK